MIPQESDSLSKANFSDVAMSWMADLGYTHCFYVAGGNSMHLLRAASDLFEMIPFVHEATAGIAAEHFNLFGEHGGAFVLVTTGPGLTNLMTPVASSWVESRSLVVICGAVKSSDLKRRSGVRQRGIQEMSAHEVFGRVSKKVLSLDAPCGEADFKNILNLADFGRKGPVVVEIPIDVQGRLFLASEVPVRLTADEQYSFGTENQFQEEFDEIMEGLKSASRPCLLIGGGVDKEFFTAELNRFQALGIPMLTSWNASDYLGPWCSSYAGRPDNFGQRSGNLIVHQADFILAVGTRLSLQLTGFNWQSFASNARIAHVDIDDKELEKGHPKTEWQVWADAQDFLGRALRHLDGWSGPIPWLEYCSVVRSELSGTVDSGERDSTSMSPQNIVRLIQEIAPDGSVFIPSSSGTAEIAVMQGLELRRNQRLIVSKGLASMGYGLPGAIGSALANPTATVFCIEGDGSLAQSMSDLSTIVGRNLRIVIIILDNGGYASIRATQKRFLGSAVLGTDRSSELHLPDFFKVARALGFGASKSKNLSGLRDSLARALLADGPHVIVAKVSSDSELPRVSSDLHDDGNLVSRPTWDMSPPLPDAMLFKVAKYVTVAPSEEEL